MSEANIKTLVKVTISNKSGLDIDCGDDWDLEGFGNNLVEAINAAFESDEEMTIWLDIDSVYATLVDVAVVDGRVFYEPGSREYTEDDVEKYGFLDIPESSQYKHRSLAKKLLKASPIIKKHNDELAKEKELELEKAKEQQEQKDREDLNRLMKKFGIKGNN